VKTPIAPPAPRSPWQRLYAAAHRRRVERWHSRVERLPVPVWSVGNLHWGGTGKTPLVAALATWLRDRGVAVAVLSRGYGRRGGKPLLVSRGDGPLVSPELAGDEPFLLAEQLQGVTVAVAARRADAGRLLLSTLASPPSLFLLDDGFSHLPLARDLDLLVLPADDPFGGGRLLPSGRLREPLAAAARAHALLLTGPAATAEEARAVGASLAQHGFRGGAFACVVAPGAPRLVPSTPGSVAEREATAAGSPAGSEPGRLLLVTGVARPERVRLAAEQVGLEVATYLAMPDHHAYPARSLRRIALAAERAGAAGVLTTAKDRVKLAGRLPLPLWELPVEARPEPAFWDWLAERL
jgi:tetraacyldisaccharide 4'-kinase